MLVSATSVARKGTTELFAHIALLPSLRLLAVHRSGLRYNWWHAPASAAPRTGWIGFNVVLGGGFTSLGETVSESRPVRNERSAWLYSEDDFEGSLGRRRHAFCAHGDPFQSVAVHVQPALTPFRVRQDGRPEQLVVPRSLYAACERYLAATQRGVAASEWSSFAREVAEALKAAGWLTPAVDVTMPTEGDARISDVLSQIIGRFDPSAQLAEFADRSAITPRRVDRLLRSWIAEYGLPNESWRAVSHRWRLKMAVMLCSSVDYSVAEVARVVGYTSTNAMTNAFATAGLPPPSWYRTTDLLQAGPARDTT